MGLQHTLPSQSVVGLRDDTLPKPRPKLEQQKAEQVTCE